MKKSLYAAIFACALAFASTSQAAMIHLAEQLDLRRADFASSGFTGTTAMSRFSARPSITLGEGDTLNYTIRFMHNETLTLENLSFIWALSYSDFANSVVDGSGTFSFLDANGRPILTSMMKSDSEGQAHFGQQFYADDFASGLPGSITFSGIRYTGTLDNYENPAILSRTYSTPAFYFRADASVIGVAAMPEPGTWAMLLGGFGIVGATLRRRAMRYARS